MTGTDAGGPLSRLPVEVAAALDRAGTRRTRKAGTHLFWEGDQTADVFFVLSGSVKVTTVARDGQEIVLSVLGQGDVLGELSALDGRPRSATATVLTTAELLVVPQDRFWTFADEHPSVSQMLFVELAQRIRSTSQRQLEFGTADAMARVCRRLVEMADRYGSEQSDGAIEVRSPLTQTDLGAWSGLSRDAVVKALRGLRELGWIENSASRLRLVETDRIRARADFWE